MAYLVSLEADSPLVEALLKIVNGLLELLYVPDLEESDLTGIDLGGQALRL